MKRLTFVAAALLMLAQGAWAQQSGQGQGQQSGQQAEEKPKPKPLDPADVETLTGRPYGNGQAEPAPKPGHPLNGVPAPKKGHPLDWRDVDILTGKADRAPRQTYAPYVYVDPGYGRFGTYGRRGAAYNSDSFFDSQSTRTSPLFVPRSFGRFHSRNFFSFDAGRSRFFFTSGRRHGSSFFFF